MFFHLQPETAFLSDLNGDLVNAYLTVRDSCDQLQKILKSYHKLHSESFYYKIRASKPRNSVYKAARFIYLNRTCWNGLYRVNKKGEFNVPMGTKTNVILDSDDFSKISKLLKGIEIEACDFQETVDKASRGDFVFIDPPYTVKHNLNGFIKYNETIFSWEDQIRLRNCISRAVDRGAQVLVMNAHHKSIEDLYQDMGEMVQMNRASVIAGKAEFRGVYSELAIKCW